MPESSNAGFPDSFGPDESLLQAVITLQVQDWMRGERNPVDSYLDRHPDLRTRPSAVLDLLYQEVILREMAGETPRPEDYQGRYDGLVESISRLFEVHRALQTTSMPAGPRNRPTDPDEIALEDLPGYDIEGTLGRGGMGVVYLARHRGLNRRVALKMLHSGSRARPEQRARFLREAEAVAKCQHPNLVQVFEVGEHSGSPFLALEYVDGGSLAQALAGLPQTPQRSAWLVEILARAIDHAHRKGVVHRDLKPSNVLMTIEGAPKITDFGLAKLLDDLATRTEDGAILGTASYMAPEQASGGSSPVGPAADIYALGAILYECLTGRPPFQDQDVLAALERVRSQPPLPPSKLQPKLPGDIETICLKCLEKEPKRRYGNAAALAEDLRRFMEGRTILARRASTGEKLIRWTRRNRWAAAFMALLMLAVIASCSLTYWAIRAENSARISAREAVARAEITEAVDQFVRKDLLSQASVFNHARGGFSPDPDLKVRTALDRASATIGGRFQGRPRVEAAIQHTIGETYFELGLYEQAGRHLERSLDLRRRELGESHPETIASTFSLGTLLQADGKTSESEALLVPALDRFRRVMGNTHPDTLEAMVAVAGVRTEQEKYEDSERLLLEAWNGFRASKGDEDNQTLEVMSSLANLYCEQKKNLDQAKSLLDRVIEVSTRRDGPEHPQALLAKSSLAGVYDRLGRPADAHQLFEEVVPKLKRVLGAESSQHARVDGPAGRDEYPPQEISRGRVIADRGLESQPHDARSAAPRDRPDPGESRLSLYSDGTIRKNRTGPDGSAGNHTVSDGTGP